MTHRSSLLSKIATVMWMVAALSTIMASILTGGLLIQNHRESIHKQLETAAASLIALGISDFSELDDFDQLNLFIEDALEMEKVDKVVRIYDATGKMVFTTAGMDYDSLPNKLEALETKPIFLTLGGIHRKYESLVVPYLGKGKKKPFYLQVAIPLPHYSQIFKTLWWQDSILLFILIVISLFLSRRLSKRLLKPVVVIADHIKAMDPSRTDQWKPLLIGDQGLYLSEIIGGINLLTEKTKRAVFQLRRMGRFVAHEMRTPLTILQGEAETILAREKASSADYVAVLKSSLEEIQRMSDTVDAILRVAEWERTSTVFQPTLIEILPWIQEHRPRWEQTLLRRVVFDLEKGEGKKIYVDPKLLYHLVDNLIRNVRDHTQEDSTAWFSILPNQDSIIVRIEDNGPGISQALLNALKEKDSVLEEVGIGLNLCQKIAEICGLRLEFSNRVDDGKSGLRVDIFF